MCETVAVARGHPGIRHGSWWPADLRFSL